MACIRASWFSDLDQALKQEARLPFGCSILRLAWDGSSAAARVA
jgi:hypothetical protein